MENNGKNFFFCFFATMTRWLKIQLKGNVFFFMSSNWIKNTEKTSFPFWRWIEIVLLPISVQKLGIQIRWLKMRKNGSLQSTHWRLFIGEENWQRTSLRAMLIGMETYWARVISGNTIMPEFITFFWPGMPMPTNQWTGMNSGKISPIPTARRVKKQNIFKNKKKI